MTEGTQGKAQFSKASNFTMWLQGRMLIHITEHLYCKAHWIKEWKQRLQDLHISSQQYSSDAFKSKFVTYVRVSITDTRPM